MTTTIRLCPLEDIPLLGARRYRRGDGLAIAVFRTAGDALFAIADRCPHRGGPLSQGIVFGESVACPLHNWTISLRTGEAAAPDAGEVERFAVRVVDGLVELTLEGSGSAMPPGECAAACAGAARTC